MDIRGFFKPLPKKKKKEKAALQSGSHSGQVVSPKRKEKQDSKPIEGEANSQQVKKRRVGEEEGKKPLHDSGGATHKHMSAQPATHKPVAPTHVSKEKQHVQEKSVVAMKRTETKKRRIVLDSDSEEEEEPVPHRPVPKVSAPPPAVPAAVPAPTHVVAPTPAAAGKPNISATVSPVKSSAATPKKKRAPATPKKKAGTPKKGGGSQASAKAAGPKPPSFVSAEQIEAIKSQEAVKWYDRANKSEAADTVSLPLPVGAPNCLNGISLLLSGEMPTIGREEGVDLIRRYGGIIKSGVSKKLDYLVIGAGAGPSKVKKACEMKVDIIDESGLRGMIESTAPKGSSASSGAGAGSSDVSVAAPPPKPVPPPPKAGAPQFRDAIHQMQVEYKNRGDAKSVPAAKAASSSSGASDGLWVSKHKPKSMEEIIGNPGNVRRLYEWLQTWDAVHLKGQTAKMPPSRGGWGKSVGPFRAVLLSGPPGVGKSTAAAVVAAKLGFTVVEFNASDTRSKKVLQNEVEGMTSNTSITQFMKKPGAGVGGSSMVPSKKSSKSVVVMDEADGMSSGDRGGIAEMIQMIKKTKVPIIAICNDSSSPKVRSLINYCEHLQFRRTPVEQISKRIATIARNEGLAIDQQALWKLVESTRGDIRQILTVLQLWRRNTTSLSFDDVNSRVKAAAKNIDMGPFDVTPKFFASGPRNPLTITDRVDLYFNDYHLIPLMVQENYLNYVKYQGTRDSRQQIENVERVAAAAESISDADLVEESIYHGQNWQLSPLHGVLSCIRPATLMGGYSMTRLNFPGWLGKNSTAKKRKRLLYEVHLHSHLATTAGPVDYALYCIPALHEHLVYPLLSHGQSAVDQVLGLMNAYALAREDLDCITELSVFPSKVAQKSPWERIPAAVKGALTRRWNKGPYLMHVAPKVVLKGKKRKIKDDDLPGAEGAVEAGVSTRDDADESTDSSDDELAIVEASRSKKKAPKRKAKGKQASRRGKGKGKRM